MTPLNAIHPADLCPTTCPGVKLGFNARVCHVTVLNLEDSCYIGEGELRVESCENATSLISQSDADQKALDMAIAKNQLKLDLKIESMGLALKPLSCDDFTIEISVVGGEFPLATIAVVVVIPPCAQNPSVDIKLMHPEAEDTVLDVVNVSGTYTFEVEFEDYYSTNGFQIRIKGVFEDGETLCEKTEAIQAA